MVMDDMDKHKKYIKESIINEGKYAKYLEAGKKKKTMRKDMIADYNKLVKQLKKQLTEINKLMDKHIKKQNKDPMNNQYIVEVHSYVELLEKVLYEMDIRRRF